MFYFFKKLLRLFFLLINFFFLFFYIPFFLLKFFKEKKIFYLQHEGGFGHSITSSEMLSYYYKNGWILIFAFSKRRHNKLIKKIYNNNLFFLNVELTGVFSERINKFLFNYIYIILKYLFKKKTFFIQNIKTLNFIIDNNDLARSRYYPISHKTTNKIFVPYCLRSKFQKVLEKNYGNFKSRILFFLRYKDFKESKIRLRDSQPLEFYKDIILNLVSNNFQIIFQGDLIEYPNWVKNLGKSVIFLDKSGLSKDEYGIFAGMVPDVAIGPHSGAMYYAVAQKKKILILEHLFLGDALPNSIVSYPKISFKSLSDFKDLIIKYNGLDNVQEYLTKYPSYQNLSSEETGIIILDFINNLNNKNYGIKPEKFGIKKGILFDCKAKLSPAWLKIVGL
jgi:hypothetical protein